jgi:hypothetical protein
MIRAVALVAVACSDNSCSGLADDVASGSKRKESISYQLFCVPRCQRPKGIIHDPSTQNGNVRYCLLFIGST